MNPVPDGTERRLFYVFLACSRELEDERAGFDEAVAHLNTLPHVRRACRVVSRRWETDAAGYDSSGANQAIAESVDFPHLDVVVICVWNKVGQWTREEYDRALAQRRVHPKPEILVFIRSQPLGREEPAAVTEFRERVFSDGVVAVPYDKPAEFFALLSQHIRPVEADATLPAAVSLLTRSFRRTAVANFLLALGTVVVSTIMSFPDNAVTMPAVLFVLAAPIGLLATTVLVAVSFHRILQAFRSAWRSPAYTDDRIWLDFLPSVPRWAFPAYLRSAVPTGAARSLWTTLMILLALGSGPVASYVAVFNEIAVWEYVVGWHWQVAPDGERVTSLFVDARRSPWRFGLQNLEVRDAHAANPTDLIYVHAQGKFCNPLERPVSERFRCNLGPEVKTLYLWLFFGAFVLSASLAVIGLTELARLGRTSVRPVEANPAP